MEQDIDALMDQYQGPIDWRPNERFNVIGMKQGEHWQEFGDAPISVEVQVAIGKIGKDEFVIPRQQDRVMGLERILNIDDHSENLPVRLWYTNRDEREVAVLELNGLQLLAAIDWSTWEYLPIVQS